VAGFKLANFNMNRPLSDKIKGKPRILVAPLDWGLGHATRCIPVIKELINQGCDVWLAGEGAQQELLSKEFPSLPFLPLKGYRIKYAKTRRGLIWKMIAQGPKFKRAIKYENKWLKKTVAENSIDAVISDNRYGLYHATIPSVIITHQLAIKTGFVKWTERILQKRNYDHLNKFTTCWVPDFSGPNNLAGELSHTAKMPEVPVHYIGFLSRLEQKEINEIEKHLLVLISGPEPQRSMLEEKVIEQISHYIGTATVLRGLPGSASLIPSTGMLKFHNHLSAEELSREMQKASYVISRSGYSTIMDMAAMNKKSILIPTPGQTEQEYLGKYLMGKKMAVVIQQNEFSLSAALQTAYNFQYAGFKIASTNLLKETISHFLDQSFPADFG
jgi:uncharacterized protein (TIGR00661 family)